MIKIGYKIGPEQYTPSEMLEQTIAVEENGFDSIDVSDHFHPWSEEGQSCFTWSWLGAAAVSTKKIKIGTGVTCPILRYHPAIIAQAAATVASLAGGRTYLGLGTGEALNEYPVTCEWPEYNERQEMLAESIKLIRELWSGEKITFDGMYYCTQDAKLYTLPPRDIPIYISTMVPESAQFAGYHGDGMISVGGSRMKVYKQLMEKFENGAKRAGKDISNMPRMVELFVAYGDRLEESLERLHKYWAGAFIPALFTNKIYTPAMSQQNGEVVGDDILRQKACISSDPEEHAKYIKQYMNAGFTHIYIHYAGPDELKFIKSYAEDVLPLIREQRSA
ncbi:TIGR03557 family F420-dependent LLM class oxidoreductase [Methanolobus chelungpuianus]|uniref:F420-dependent oxidoreductase n=1 Tax=Methanolobus chelungpuianus TaxID=502115 RepID=A0AAE3H8V2_9EURY|nr:TIGR03557 family F420-dependent LLM class oxidoreductase [Methanolobus chelungpuianus]MCQ6962282.1 F420-dependent oxidoreductase [Methanolobus chelungpuianus]